ncbi:hypothetical protein B0H15DRAFT_43026 [Mycena belliarum]|uniref:Uncharacterized protein n=1 Tax=Mycena belliarum TaxID=1033014 RepID=A0AAD6XJ11_9AGAR|nr:hypothetical protein B0H15DRAFT_43026 [Mycena belliae]
MHPSHRPLNPLSHPPPSRTQASSWYRPCHVMRRVRGSLATRAVGRTEDEVLMGVGRARWAGRAGLRAGPRSLGTGATRLTGAGREEDKREIWARRGGRTCGPGPRRARDAEAGHGDGKDGDGDGDRGWESGTRRAVCIGARGEGTCPSAGDSVREIEHGVERGGSGAGPGVVSSMRRGGS